MTKLSSCECMIRAVLSLLKLACWLRCACVIHHTSARPLETSGVTKDSQTSLIHTVVPTECNLYQDWQVLGLYWSWKRLGSPGMFTRIACCEFDRLKGKQSINPYQLYYTNTNIDPDGIGDHYLAYNKPYGMMSWLQDVNPAGEYFLVVDADMTFHRSVTAGELGVRPGLGAGQFIWYMEELNQFVAPMLLPVQPTAAIGTNRHLQHDTKQTADAVLTNVKTATVMLQQQAQVGQAAAHKLQEDPTAAPRALKRQGQRGDLRMERQSQRAVLQEATDSRTQEAVTDQAAAAPVVPLADEVGEIYMYTGDDIRAIAPLWWNYTIQMRVFHETHEQELPKDTPIERPWIAEMFGIALGAAQLGIHHRTYDSLVAHPPDISLLNREGPSMFMNHYAWNAEVPSKGWKWNKHAFKNWSPLTCPPWTLDLEMFEEAWDQQYPASRGGLFPHPPLPSELINQEPEQLFKDLINIEMVAMLNEAFCELHHKPYCPPSEELTRECGKVTKMMQELSDHYQTLANGSDIFCIDTKVLYCAHLNSASDKALRCQQQATKDSCRRSCDMCYAKADSSSLVWYNQDRHSLAPYPTLTHDQIQASSEGVTGGSNHARLDAYTRHGSQLDALPGITTHGSYANPDGQLDGSCGHFTAAAAPNGDLAPDQSVSMHAGLRSQDNWPTPWSKHLSNPFCKAVLFLCALLLALTIWLARGRIRRRRSLQYLRA